MTIVQSLARIIIWFYFSLAGYGVKSLFQKSLDSTRLPLRICYHQNLNLIGQIAIPWPFGWSEGFFWQKLRKMINLLKIMYSGCVFSKKRKSWNGQNRSKFLIQNGSRRGAKIQRKGQMNVEIFVGKCCVYSSGFVGRDSSNLSGSR